MDLRSERNRSLRLSLKVELTLPRGVIRHTCETTLIRRQLSWFEDAYIFGESRTDLEKGFLCAVQRLATRGLIMVTARIILVQKKPKRPGSLRGLNPLLISQTTYGKRTKTLS